MPIYEYRCNACGSQFECLQMQGEKDLRVTCPECESSDVAKVFSLFSSPGSSAVGECGPISYG